MRSRDAVSREMTVSSDPVSRMKSWSRPPLTLACTMILSCSSVKGIVWSMFWSCSSMSTGCLSPNDIEEVHLGAGPCGLLAAVLVGKQVDVVAVRVGGLRELAQPLVDVADQGVNLTVTRCAGRGGERHVEGLVQTAGRGERAGHAEAGARDESGACATAIAIRAIGFVEESCRPQRVAIERDGFRIVGRDLPECLGFAPGASELGDLQRGANRSLCGHERQ